MSASKVKFTLVFTLGENSSLEDINKIYTAMVVAAEQKPAVKSCVIRENEVGLLPAYLEGVLS